MGLSSSTSWAQTFTAGASGALTRVELRLDKEAGTTAPLTVQVRSVSAGAPTATVLASKLVPAADLAVAAGSDVPVESITFATPASIVSGSQYAIVVHNNGGAGGFRIGAANTNAYPQGAAFATFDSPPAAAWTPQAFDLWFQTLVLRWDPACVADSKKRNYTIINGTDGNDTINGTAGNDLIYGFYGNDVINGRGGNDLICAGFGNDRVSGGGGIDKIYGGPGNDRLAGNDGNDTLRGNDGNDTLLGGNGRDNLLGEQGNDVLRGNAGKDFLDGGFGRDVLRGGDGDDRLRGGPGKDDVAQ